MHWILATIQAPVKPCIAVSGPSFWQGDGRGIATEVPSWDRRREGPLAPRFVADRDQADRLGAAPRLDPPAVAIGFNARGRA